MRPGKRNVKSEMGAVGRGINRMAMVDETQEEGQRTVSASASKTLHGTEHFGAGFIQCTTKELYNAVRGVKQTDRKRFAFSLISRPIPTFVIACRTHVYDH